MAPTWAVPGLLSIQTEYGKYWKNTAERLFFFSHKDKVGNWNFWPKKSRYRVKMLSEVIKFYTLL